MLLVSYNTRGGRGLFTFSGHTSVLSAFLWGGSGGRGRRHKPLLMFVCGVVSAYSISKLAPFTLETDISVLRVAFLVFGLCVVCVFLYEKCKAKT